MGITPQAQGPHHPFFQRQQAQADLAVQGDQGTWNYIMDMSQRCIKIPYFIYKAFIRDLPHTVWLLGRLNLCAVALWDSIVSLLGAIANVGRNPEGRERDKDEH